MHENETQLSRKLFVLSDNYHIFEYNIFIYLHSFNMLNKELSNLFEAQYP